MPNFWIPSKRHKRLPCSFFVYLWWFISWLIVQYHEKGSHLWIFKTFLSCVALPQLLFGFMLRGQHKQQVSRSTDWCARLQLLSGRFSSTDKRLWPQRGTLPTSQGLPRVWRTSKKQPKPETRAYFCLLPTDVSGTHLWEDQLCENSKLKGWKVWLQMSLCC